MSSYITFSKAQVDEARDADDRDWDVDSVLTVVQKAARSWNPDRLQRFPDLRCAAYEAQCLMLRPFARLI